jgi:hypothetical protein
MAITRLDQHDTHPVRIHLTREGKHYAALRCCQCDKHIQWLSREDADSLQQLGVTISRGAKTTLFLSRGANTYKLHNIGHLYEPKGPYLRELAVPKAIPSCVRSK